ncbi:MAG: hypothetical protein LBB82_09065, partial [Treponema sp.]|nr:hypothetical protein [Treponema sp.]
PSALLPSALSGRFGINIMRARSLSHLWIFIRWCVEARQTAPTGTAAARTGFFAAATARRYARPEQFYRMPREKNNAGKHDNADDDDFSIHNRLPM